MNPLPFPSQSGAFGALPLPRYVRGSISKKFPEPLRRQDGIACRILYIADTEIGLDCACRGLQGTDAQAFINSGSLITPFAATASVLKRSSSVSIPISSALASPAFKISGIKLRTVAAA